MKSQTYLNICGVPTKVVTWGRGLAEVNTNDEAQDIVLMIPGNPGFTPFYDEFLQEIHNRLNCSVWIVGHAGHEVPKNFHQIIPALAGNEALFDLHGQVVHKVTFIEQYVPMNARLHLIGHSIGAYIILQLLKAPTIKSQVIGSYLLFPTIERLSESPNGNFYQKLITVPLWLPSFLAHVYTILPEFVKTFLMEVVGTVGSIPKSCRSACRDLIHPTIVERIITLVSSEFVAVKDRDNEILKANKDKIKIYYGASDGWAPQGYYLKLKSDLPDIDAELCSHNYDHAFVLYHSKEVANLVVDWIRMKQL